MVFDRVADTTQWRVEVNSLWDVFGPFPIHAREQHFISPAFPLDLSQSIDYGRSWPSAYADGGMVKWSQATSTPEGDIEISFPFIRWKDLRATEGWAALQHHAVLRTTLKFYPPSSLEPADKLPVFIHLKQGSYFTLRPKGATSGFVPRWYAGNIYDLERALPHALELELSIAPASTEPVEYDLFVSGDYEIRLFGDPLVRHSEVPIQKLNISIQVKGSHASLLHHTSQDIACDFLNGFAFGDVLGVGIQSLKGWWTVQDVFLKTPATDIVVGLRVKSMTIAPLQTRVIPIFLTQSMPFNGETIDLDVLLTSDNLSEIISVKIAITHHESQLLDGQVLKTSFLFAGSIPSAFLAVPPLVDDVDPCPPILALHGAGVDVFGHDFWMKSLPKNKHSWIIAPTGRTSWGLDWHGPSTVDAWASLEALAALVHRVPYEVSRSWKIAPNTRVVIIGHSNGGQGTWHITSRYPDRVLAAVAAAAYIKSQAYIPLTLARSGHFIDPALRGILESSLTPDDNDLHIPNLVDTPVLAIHGGADENVPVWHSREAVSALKFWYPSANITLKEDPGEGHWYPSVLSAPEVQMFLDGIITSAKKAMQSDSFTLTVANPRECGSLHGWRINKLVIPGRLARLHVQKKNESTFELHLSNVHTFTIPFRETPLEILIDEQVLHFASVQEKIQISKANSQIWQQVNESSNSATSESEAPSRIQSILTSPGPIIIVISEKLIEQNLSVAQRLAHVLYLYHRIDSEIIPEHVALHRTEHASWPAGNVVFVGPPSSQFAKLVLDKNSTPVQVVDSTIRIATQKFSKPGQAVLFIHPHPTGVKPESLLLFILYNSESGLERAIRLFPFRTGVAVPDWLVVGGKMDIFGAGGIEAAGVWGRDWTLSEAMSWPSR